MDECAALAESIRGRLGATHLTEKVLRVTASLGIAVLPDYTFEPNTLVELANNALYEAKKLGRNLVRISGETDNTSLGLKDTPLRMPDIKPCHDPDSLKKTAGSGE